MDHATALTLESVIDPAIRVVGSGIEIFGVLIIVIGIAWSTYLYLQRPVSGEDVDAYKIRMGRSLLLALEVLKGLPPNLNRGDSLGVTDERVFRH